MLMTLKKFDRCTILLLAAMVALGAWVIWLGEETCLSNGMSYANYAGLKLQIIGATIVATSIILFIVTTKRINNPKQRLFLVFPVPTKIQTATALVLLSDGDGKVYRYVMAHGGEKIVGQHTYAYKEETETRVAYFGKPIYDSYRRRFTIEGGAYRSRTIIVHVQPV
jgi:hypothetical protein